ncbi:excalibur calcium-binding domain-containing protein [Phenylobacterium sp.]|uniref:excalibur calcium-binding domain-containing protein n=1 Tax=Phenylobacterium sp. TaxID=1871053 RepID=UPI00351F5541
MGEVLRCTCSAVGLMWAVCLPTSTLAHSGGLNAEGCHNDRKNGGYHCHRSGSSPARALSGSGGSDTRTQRSRPAGGAYANCAAARAAGAAPVRRGQPGYGPHLDRDGDGVGCER